MAARKGSGTTRRSAKTAPKGAIVQKDETTEPQAHASEKDAIAAAEAAAKATDAATGDAARQVEESEGRATEEPVVSADPGYLQWRRDQLECAILSRADFQLHNVLDREQKPNMETLNLLGRRVDTLVDFFMNRKRA